MTHLDRLSPLDADFLALEKIELPMHLGGLLVFEGPAPTSAQWRDAIEQRLPAVPRYRQRVREIPLQLNTPVWVDDQHFDLESHLRHVALPPPGDELALRALTSRLMSQRIDLSRPLWEMWLIDGLTGGRWALLNKVHHAMVDGQSGRDLMEILLADQRSRPSTRAPRWRPRSEPDTGSLVGAAVADVVTDPVRTAERLVGSLARPGELAQQALARAAGTVGLGPQRRAEDILVGKVGPRRRWTWVELDLATVKQVKDAFAATVTDVLLAAITAGLRGLLLEAGEPPAAHASIRAMVPVSVRGPEDRPDANLVSTVLLELPVGEPDPVARLRTVTSSMAALTHSPEALSVATIVAGAPFVPPALIAAAGRVAARLPQRSFGTVATNVPGPQRPLYFLDRQLIGLIPFMPLGPNNRTAVAITSYHGGVWCGITADYDSVPDVELIGEGILAAVAELAAEG